MPVSSEDVGHVARICQQHRRRVRYGALGAAISTRAGNPKALPQNHAQATVTMLNKSLGGKCPAGSWVVDETGYPAGYGTPPNDLFDPNWSDGAPVLDDVQTLLSWLDREAPGWDAQLQSTYALGHDPVEPSGIARGENRVLADISAFIAALHTDSRHGPATLLYNEGWMLRLVLGAAARGIRGLPAPFAPGARWFTEALIYTPFRARTRGDKLAESVTHADGVIGHFDIGRSSRAGLHLSPEATQLVVAEAKMFSGLSRGTTRAPGYDQAARNVACMAWTLAQAGRTLDSYRSIGFWVLAPEEQIRSDVFACVTRGSVEEKIRQRVAQYEEAWRETRLDPWVREWLIPLLDRLQIACLSWESVVSDIESAEPEFGAALREFYGRCIAFNRIPALARGL